MKLLNQITSLALETPDKEVCGFICASGRDVTVVPMKNLHEKPEDNYEIDVREYLKLKETGTLVASYHSHPNGSLSPTAPDIASSEELQLPSMIFGTPMQDMICYIPKSCHFRDLAERPFIPTLFDCLTLCEDYYEKIKQIELKKMFRTFRNWNKVAKLIPNFMIENGFEKVLKPTKEGDVVVMAFDNGIPIHTGLYMGDGIMIHQQIDVESSFTPYGGYWERSTCFVMRHKSQF